MSSPGPAPISEDTEEGRALLQSRVALFWKVVCGITALSAALGLIGAVVKPAGLHVFVTLAQLVQAALFWQLCARGTRSVRFSRWMEISGLLLNFTAGSILGRFVVGDFVREHAFVTSEGTLMTDAYVTTLHVAGYGMWLAIRAALVPSSPRTTIFVTAASGIPLVACTVLVLNDAGHLVLRTLPSDANPWLPVTSAMLWGFVVIACTVTSWVIYGLRAQVREARSLGQYVLETKIGEGGMGEVYRAHHGMMKRPSALKLIRSDKAGAGGLLRFEREVQQTARLTHPSTITIFDYGRTHDGVFYYAMELLDGATLQRIVEVSGPQSPGRVVRILTMACAALNEAHGIGLIHRDIKPANIMLCKQGGERDIVKLLDFGLVKQLEVEDDVKLTRANTITGTPQYMAPESIRDPDSADARTDLYSLGAVAYYLLAGTELFDGRSVVEVCSQHLHEEPKPFAEHGVAVPPALEAIVRACLAKAPADRPPSAADLQRRLASCDLPPWTAEHADAWWREHEAQVQQRPRPSGGGGKTLQVDRGARQSAVEVA